MTAPSLSELVFLLTFGVNAHVNTLDSPGFLQCFLSVTPVGSLPHAVIQILIPLDPADNVCALVSSSNTTVKSFLA